MYKNQNGINDNAPAVAMRLNLTDLDGLSGKRIGPYTLGVKLGDNLFGNLQGTVYTAVGGGHQEPVFMLLSNILDLPDLNGQIPSHRVSLSELGLQHPSNVHAITDNPVLHTVYASGRLPNEGIYIVADSIGDYIGVPVPAQRAVALVEKLAKGLAALQRRGVYHYNLQPPNVIGTPDNPKLIYFNPPRKDPKLCGIELEPIEYLSTEQVRGKPRTPHTDVNGLALVLYYALTGKPPIPSQIPEKDTDKLRYIVKEIDSGRDLDLSNVVDHPNIKGIADLVRKSTIADPTRRPTMERFASELSRLNDPRVSFGQQVLGLITGR